jgi:hypothetical protein
MLAISFTKPAVADYDGTVSQKPDWNFPGWFEHHLMRAFLVYKYQ